MTGSKVFYVLNLSLQLWLVDDFLGNRLYSYTFHTLARMFKGLGWTASNMFPLVAECRWN